MPNINNCGHIAGTLAEKPEFKETEYKANVISFVVTTGDDPSDKDKPAKRRINQNVKVTAYAKANEDVSHLECLQPGDYFSCDFWVESYMYTAPDGTEHLTNSLKTSVSDIALGDPSYIELDDIPGFEPSEAELRDPLDSGYDPGAYEMYGSEYSGPDYDFMDDEMIDDMVRAGDTEAAWYSNNFRGGDYDVW